MTHDVGLHSGLSEDLNRWANLTDEVLAAIRAGSSLHGNQSVDELKRLIRSIANQDEATTDFSDLRIGNIVALELGKSFNWAKLGEGLDAPEISEASIESLDKLARCLSQEHARTVAKMRWRHS